MILTGLYNIWGFHSGLVVKNLLAAGVRSLGQEDPLEKEMDNHFSIVAWKFPWTKEPGGVTVHRHAKIRTRLKQLNKHAFLTPALSVFNHKWSSEITLLQVMLI